MIRLYNQQRFNGHNQSGRQSRRGSRPLNCRGCLYSASPQERYPPRDPRTHIVLVSTDKAANNITFVCKKFYISKIHEELASDNFEMIDKSVDDIVQEHEKFMLKFGIKLLPENRKLLFLYYITPKQ